MLWISASPGCGESVLSRSLIDDHQLAVSLTTFAIGFFFFKDGQQDQDIASSAMSSILHRVLTLNSHTELIQHALASYKSHGAKLRHRLYDLWTILLLVASDSYASEILCLIDALDECDKESRRMIIDLLTEFYFKTQIDATNLKFIVTSRPYMTIEDSFQVLTFNPKFFHISMDDEPQLINGDIVLVLEQEVPKRLPKLKAEDHKHIIQHIAQSKQVTYLWIRLIFELLEKTSATTGTVKRIKRAIDRSPKSMNGLYLALLQKSDDIEQARVLLQLIYAARRPLSLEELNTAWGLAQDEAGECLNIEDLDLQTIETFYSSLRSICGLLVSVQEDRVYFLHQTVREFLSTGSSNQEYNWRPFTDAEAEQTMARVCTKYLLMDDFASVDFDWTDVDRTLEHCKRTYGFLDYASCYWVVITK